MPLLGQPEGQFQFRLTSKGPPPAGIENGCVAGVVQSPPAVAGATSVRVTPLIVAFSVPVAYVAPALTRAYTSIGQLVAPASIGSVKSGEGFVSEHEARETAQTAWITGLVS